MRWDVDGSMLQRHRSTFSRIRNDLLVTRKSRSSRTGECCSRWGDTINVQLSSLCTKITNRIKSGTAGPQPDRATTMTNLSYYLLPLIWFQGPYSSSRGPLMRLKKDDNINPRLVLDSLEKSGNLSPRLIAKLRRRESCEKNCWEGLPMILAAVVAGNSVGLSEQWMNAISVGYFLFRCGYSMSHWLWVRWR